MRTITNRVRVVEELVSIDVPDVASVSLVNDYSNRYFNNIESKLPVVDPYGYDDNSAMSNLPEAIWQSCMEKGLSNEDAESFVTLFIGFLDAPSRTALAVLRTASITLAAKVTAKEVTLPPKPLLPDVAPILYAERQRRPDLARSDIIDFLRAVYGPWLDGTLTRHAFRQLDPKGEMALRNWLRKDDLPSDVQLPTRSEVISDEIDDAETLRRAKRLTWAHASRLRS